MEKRSKFNYDLITVGLMYLLSFVFYKGTFSILNEGSRVFPRAIAIVAIFLATVLLIRSVVLKKREQYNFDEGQKIVVLTVFCVVYIFLMKYIGFYIATPLFLIASFKYLEVASKKVLMVIPISIDIIVLVCFDILFRVPIPMGTLIEPVLKSMNLI